MGDQDFRAGARAGTVCEGMRAQRGHAGVMGTVDRVRTRVTVGAITI